ncbi:hypothetical protein ACTFIY_005497 [Dictyostelium cf. discoideum]
MKIFFLFLILLGIIKLSNSSSCNVDIGGYSFDLTPLRKNDGYHKIISDYGDIVYFNFCNTTIDTPCGNTALAYFFDGSTGECHSLGVQEFYSLNSYDAKKTLLINIRGGDIAFDSMVKMLEMFIAFTCDETDDTSEPSLINTMEYGYASVIWSTKYSCAIKTPNVEKKLLIDDIQNNNNFQFENNEILNEAQSNAFDFSNKNEDLYNNNNINNNNNNKINNGISFLQKLNQMSQIINDRNENENENEKYQQFEEQQNEQQNKMQENRAEIVQFNDDINPIDLEQQQPFYNDEQLMSQIKDDIEIEQDQTNFDTVNDDEIANQINDFMNNFEKTQNLDGDFINQEKTIPNFIMEDIKPNDLTQNFEIENEF